MLGFKRNALCGSISVTNRRTTMLSVYVIGSPGGPYKVGHARNPLSRLKALQTANDRPLNLYHAAQTPDAPAKERLVHAILREHGAMGEWFQCSLDEVYDAFRSIDLTAPEEDLAPDPISMSPDAFTQWTIEMRKMPFFADDADCGRMLGISANSVVAMKRNGADRRTALACRALLHRLLPYGE
jgi:hypothetical protein